MILLVQQEDGSCWWCTEAVSIFPTSGLKTSGKCNHPTDMVLVTETRRVCFSWEPHRTYSIKHFFCLPFLFLLSKSLFLTCFSPSLSCLLLPMTPAIFTLTDHDRTVIYILCCNFVAATYLFLIFVIVIFSNKRIKVYCIWLKIQNIENFLIFIQLNSLL